MSLCEECANPQAGDNERPISLFRSSRQKYAAWSAGDTKSLSEWFLIVSKHVVGISVFEFHFNQSAGVAGPVSAPAPRVSV